MTKVKAVKKAGKVQEEVQQEYTPFTQISIVPLKVDSNVDEIRALTDLMLNVRNHNTKLTTLVEEKLTLVVNRIN